MRRSLGCCLVVVVAVLAGCTAISGSAVDGDHTTPVAVPEETTPLAPGVPAAAVGDADRRYVNTDRLRRADERRRAATSYRLSRTVTVDGAAGTLRIDRVRVQRADGAAVEHLSTESTGAITPSVVESTLWTDGSVYWTRTTLSDGQTAVNRRHPNPPAFAREPPAPPSFHRLGIALSGRLLDAADYVVHHRQDDSVVVRSATPIELDRPVLPIALGDSRNGSVRIRVTSRGLVEELVFRYNATFAGEPVEVTVRQEISSAGTTSVSRPDWVGKAETHPTLDTEGGVVWHPDTEVLTTDPVEVGQL